MTNRITKRTLLIIAVFLFVAMSAQVFAGGAASAAVNPNIALTALNKSAGKITPQTFQPEHTTYKILLEYEDGENFTLRPTIRTGGTFTVNNGTNHYGRGDTVPLTLPPGETTTVKLTAWFGGEEGRTYTLEIERMLRYTVKENPTEDWIFYDEFNNAASTTTNGSGASDIYFECDAGEERYNFGWNPEAGLGGAGGMRAVYKNGEPVGGLKLSFGRSNNDVDYGKSKILPEVDLKEIYVRWYMRSSRNWISGGSNEKLCRFMGMTANGTWAQSFIAHLWSGGNDDTRLCVDPVSGIAADGWTQKTTKYNDFDNFRWLGSRTGPKLFTTRDAVGEWYCIEMHVKLNDPGVNNGVAQYWIDGVLEACSDNLNFIGDWNPGVDEDPTHVGINRFFLENFMNNHGSFFPAGHTQYRDYTNLVLSTKRIGPAEFIYQPEPPEEPTATLIDITPTPFHSQVIQPTTTMPRHKGDVSGDGRVTVDDILLVRDHIFATAVLQGEALWAADVNDDGRVDIIDILMIRDIIYAKADNTVMSARLFTEGAAPMQGSPDWTLASLGKSAGKLMPALFEPTHTEYKILLEYEDGADFTLTPFMNFGGGTIRVNGETTRRERGEIIPVTLPAGETTTIKLTVFSRTSIEGLTYTVDIERMMPYTVVEKPTKDWIFHDEFNDDSTTRSYGSNPTNTYYENNSPATFKWDAQAGMGGSGGMRAIYEKGKGVGGLKLSFGRTNNDVRYGTSNISPDVDYKEIYVRWYVRSSRNWLSGGNNEKLGRITGITSNASWAQNFIVHVWSQDRDDTRLCIDPASGIDKEDGITQKTTKYNDFNNLRWMGLKNGPRPFTTKDAVGEWYCIEMHVKLNDP
ncbi:MAG: cadherin-like beta sandwich domain-containing protein, partial [Clostridia bacterium]|nr:cadherin-like beta sandwich domain-containing protein [Clostridia bacterium]